MRFTELQALVADWYQVAPDTLGLDPSAIPGWLHPVLAEFYRRFGTLALQHDNPFKHPAAFMFPLSGQDEILPLTELADRDGFTVFCSENQGIFCAAARKDGSDGITYAKGDAVLDEYVPDFISTGVPLAECLVTLVLQETILSISDRYPRTPQEGLEEYKSIASAGETITTRYLWPDAPITFHISKDIWFMDHDGLQFAAHRGFWREAPETIRDRLRNGE